MYLRKLIDKTRNEISTYATSAVGHLEHLLKVTTDEKIGKTNKFNFNDLDNNAWLEKPNVVTFDNQNSYLIGVKISDEWHVLRVDKNQSGYEKTYKSVIKKIDGADSIRYELNDHFVMTFKPLDMMEFLKQITQTNLSDDKIQEEMRKFRKNEDNIKDFVVSEFSGNLPEIDHVLFQLNHTSSVLASEFNIQASYPVDITSHDYQIKYACSTYPKTRTDFYSHVFMTLGGGYHWDGNGNLVEMDAVYKSNINKTDINSIPKGNLTHIYLAFDSDYNNLLNYPNNIQPEWQKARLEYIEQLKEIIKEFPTWSKENQDGFLSVRDGKPYFTIEQLEKFIEKCEQPKTSTKKKM